MFARQQDAVAELCWEIGVALEADWGACGTATPIPKESGRLCPTCLRFDDGLIWFRGSAAHTAQSWFDLIRAEIDAGRPSPIPDPRAHVGLRWMAHCRRQLQLHANSAGGYGGNAQFGGRWIIIPAFRNRGERVRLIRPRAMDSGRRQRGNTYDPGRPERCSTGRSDPAGGRGLHRHRKPEP